MSKSNHNDYLIRFGKDFHIRTIYQYCLFRPNHPPPYLETTKYDALRFFRLPSTPENIEKVSQRIKQHLDPSLISRQMREKYPQDHLRWQRPYFGYCVPATFFLLFLMDTDNLQPMTACDPDGENHWWLEDVISGMRFDTTSDQFTESELEFVYQSGKPNRLYTHYGKPQSRFLDLMQRVQPDATRYTTSDPYKYSTSLEQFLR